MRIQLNNLANQIIALCLGLVLLTLVAVQATAWWSASNYNRHQINEHIDSAQNVLREYLKAKEKLLLTASQVLTSDFGFKQAVATRDAPTISSVLLNHGRRINADLMVLTDLNGKIISAIPSNIVSNSDLQNLLNSPLMNSGKSHLLLLNNSLYQCILLPVKAPRTIAYILIGFQFTDTVLNELKHLTGLDVSFFLGNRLIKTSIDHPQIKDLKHYLTTSTTPWFFFDRPTYSNRTISLNEIDNSQLSVMATASLSEFYGEYDRLVLNLVIIASLIILVTTLASGWLAKSLTTPLARLVKMANEFGQGHYQTSISTMRSSIEIKKLLNTFLKMGSEIEEREIKIRRQAERDGLTDLYNRHTVYHILDQYLEPQKRYLFITTNVHAFRTINDTLGPMVGDEALQAIAKRLIDYQLPEENVPILHARLDSVEFLTVLPVLETESAENNVSILLKALEKPLKVRGLDLNLKFYAGVSVFPKDSGDSKTVLRRSMVALDHARVEGLPIRFYQQGEDEAHLQRLNLIEDLKQAISTDDGELYMVYQPKLRLSDGSIDKVEALIRWKKPDQGFVSPELFINLAEQSGVIIELTKWVATAVVKQLSEWHAAGFIINAAINVSAQDLSHPDFLQHLTTTLDQHAISPQFITVEITERDIMQNEQNGLDALTALKRAGFSIAIDDYGIGQSSLGKLKELPADELKLDKSFITNLHQSETDQKIVRSTIGLAHDLDLKLVAEGVENFESMILLKQMRCDSVQGYYISKPLIAHEVSDWIRHKNASA